MKKNPQSSQIPTPIFEKNNKEVVLSKGENPGNDVIRTSTSVSRLNVVKGDRKFSSARGHDGLSALSQPSTPLHTDEHKVAYETFVPNSDNQSIESTAVIQDTLSIGGPPTIQPTFGSRVRVDEDERPYIGMSIKKLIEILPKDSEEKNTTSLNEDSSENEVLKNELGIYSLK